MVFTLILLTALLALIIILLQPSKVIHLKQLLLPGLCIIFVICLILMSGTVLQAAMSGLILWVNAIIPTLFPFFVAVEVLNTTGFLRSFDKLLEPIMKPLFNVPGSASFALVMGIISGYPVGAKITSDLRTKGMVTRTEAERLLAFTNNCGPLFITSAVGATIYGCTSIGFLLLACHILASITVGLLFRFYKSPGNLRERFSQGGRFSRLRGQYPQREYQGANAMEHFSHPTNRGRTVPFGRILGDAVKNSITTILTIGGFVVLFSVIIQLLTDIGIIRVLAEIIGAVLSPIGFGKEIIKGILSGFLEITTGSSLIGYTSDASLYVKLPTASFIIGWAGLSVHSQVMSIISKTDICIRPYLIGKFMQGIFASFYTWVGQKLFLGALLLEGTVLPKGTVLPAKKIPESVALYELTNAFRGKSLEILGTSTLLLLVTLMLFIVFLLIIKRYMTLKGNM